MKNKSNKRTIFQRVFGIPITRKPRVIDCWEYNSGKITIDLHKAPELQALGSALRIEGSNLPTRVLVVHGEDGNYRAFRNRCTHFGHRRLDPVPGTDSVQCCSINKSTFDSKGDALHGPAPHSIHCYRVKNELDKLVVYIEDH